MSSYIVPPREIYDSLPYYDDDLERYPNLKELVDKEFAKIPKPPNQLHPNVPPEITLFQNHPLLAAELERVEKGEPFPQLDSTRYQVPAPSGKNEEEWRKALDNARAQMEHMKIRQSNVSLMQNYGANAWRVNNYLLEADLKAYEKEAERMKEEVADVNRERKKHHTAVGTQLSALERKWTELISTTLQIELANASLEAEVADLRKRREEMASIVNGA